jgi:hypothetical protein
MNVAAIAEAWTYAKKRETEAVNHRRALEDQLTKALGIAEDAEGVVSRKEDGFVIKATCRLTRKIDTDALQNAAASAGLTEHLGSLFRWKPEINMKEWKAAAPEITGPLAGAITTTAGRPSYSIEKEEGNNG